ncbi:MAG: IPT/TIG domain-containing protein [Thermoanaerobacteraceae bacterium]|nr:IPT/TIG domain-containing protein [Thermoanaerobacteraceae bacterium]
MRKTLSLILVISLFVSIFSFSGASAQDHVVTMDTNLVSSGHGGQIIVSADKDHGFDVDTSVSLEFYYNGVLYTASPTVSRTSKQLIIYVPPTTEFENSAPLYTGIANIIIDKIKVLSDGSTTGDTLQFNFVKDPVIRDVYLNVETTFTRDNNGNITGTEEVRQLVIEGENFNLKELMIGGTDGIGGLSSLKGEVKILSGDSLRIVAEVPQQIVNDGTTKYEVSVRNINNGLAIRKNFIFNELSHIQSIDKTRAYPGDKLTITGTNLPDDISKITSIIIARSSVPINDNIEINDTDTLDTIKVTVPEAGDRNNKDISIRKKILQDGVYNDVQVTLKGEFTVVYTPAGLSIDRIEPNSGTTDGGTEIKIYGTGFVQGMQVFIGGYEQKNKATVRSIAVDPNNPVKTIITAVTPSSTEEGAKDVYVYNPVDGSEVRKIGGFTYISVANALTIYPEQVNPQEARETEQRSVSIVGRNISNINISNLLPENEQNSWYDIKPIAELYDPVTKEYVVHYKGKYQGNEVYIEKTVKLTIGNEANIDSINFKTGSRDQIISAKTPIVTLDPRIDTEVDVAVNTHTVAGSIYNIDPAAEERYVFNNISLETSESAVIKNGFTYKPDLTQPQIISVHPYMGSKLGGDEITIEGTDIRPGAKVYIGEETAKNLAQTVSISIYESNGNIYSTLVVKTPSSDTIGKKDIIIVNSEGGKTIKEDGYEYISNPEIISITPNVGSIHDDIFISISGSDFLVKTNENGNPILPKVWIGNQIVNITAVYDDKGNIIDGSRFKTGTRIKGYIPAGGTKTLGYADVKLVNPDYPNFTNLESYPETYDKNVIASGGKAVLEAAFKYTNPTYKMRIDSIEPVRGPVEGGTKVTITGGTFPKILYVTIDGEQAKINNSTGNTISITTPPGTVGKKTVQVISLVAGEAEGAVATMKDGFEYTIVTTNPKITSIVPAHGGKGTEVWIKGTEFVMSVPLMDENNQPVKDENGNQIYSEQSSVIVGGRKLDRVQDRVYVLNPNTISFVLPSIPDDEIPVAGSYDVYIENPDTAVSNIMRFNFQIPDSKPEIGEITPDSGSTKGGTVVEIKGKDFRQDLEVYFGGLKADIISFNEEKQTVAVKSPAHGSGPASVMILNKDGGNSVVENGFLYVSPSSNPIISSVAPNTGSTFGGDLVIINGDDFRKNEDKPPEVYFGNQKAQSVAYVKYNQINAVTPPYTKGGPVDVTVINPDTGLAVLKNGFTYTQSKPQITQIVPPILPITGGNAEIIGSGFSMRVINSEGNEVNPGSIVRIIDGDRTIDLTLNPGEDPNNPTDYNIDIVSSGRILVKIPPVSSIGPKKIQVINPDGGIAESTINFIKPLTNPTIDHIYPPSGSVKGGTPVSIYGSDFRPNAKVYIGGKEAEIKYITEDGKLIRIYTPEGDPAMIGIPQDVVVYNEGDSSAVLQDAFTYLGLESNPVITSIEPNQGSTLGGDKVTIKGDDFREDIRVFFDDAEAVKVTRINYTTIEVITPPHAAGKTDVVVKNIDAYGEAVSRDGFEFIETVPASPTGFNAEGVAGDTIRLTWDLLRGADHYQIYGRESNDNDYHFIASTEGHEYYVTGLDRDTRYYFRLEGINSYGVSESAEASARTLDTRPDRDYEDTSTRNQINVSGGTAVITLGIDEREFAFDLDLDPSKPIDIKMNIPVYLIKNSGKWVTINTPKIELEFSLGQLQNHDIASMSSGRHDGDYVIVYIKELTGSDYGSYSKFFDRGVRALSSMFELDISASVNGEISELKALNNFDIRLVYKGAKENGLYIFNDDDRAWDMVGSRPEQFTSISRTGVYAVLGR